MFTFKTLPYHRPDFAYIQKQAEERLVAFDQASSAADQYDHWMELVKIFEEVQQMSTLAEIRHTIDTRDAFYREEVDYLNEMRPKMQDIQIRFYTRLLKSPYRHELEQKTGDLIFRMAENELSTFRPEIMELLVEEGNLSTAYDRLRSSAQLDWEGEKLTLAQLTPYTRSADPDTRRKAVRLSTSFFEENAEEFDRIYDGLVKVRTKIAKMLGYENFIQLGYARMGRLDYGPEEVAKYRAAILEHVVPLVSKLKARQARRIGVEKLSFYDEAFEYPAGNPAPIGTEPELLKKARKMYHELSPETKEFFDFMLQHELMDLQARTGKNGGGYCTLLPETKAPFIFSNFNGTSDDVDVLTHEAGHAFQVFRSRNQILPEYIWPSMEACEIHSMSMEFLTWDWMKLFFEDRTEAYHYSHLAAALIFLPYGCLVDHFQHEVYLHPEMSPAERRACWRALEKQYLPDRDYADLTFLEEGGFWFRQGHIFNMAFYYIDYTLAQVCAFQFWKKSRENFEEAWKSYLHLCNLGGTLPFLSLVREAGLKNPFEPGTMPDIVHFVAHYLDTVKESELA